MIFNLDDLIAKSMHFRLQGRDWRLSELTRGDLGEIQAVVRRHAENPLVKAKEVCKELPPATAAAVWKEASRQNAYWPPPLHSEDGIQYVTGNIEIQSEVLYYGLKRDQPEVTREQCKEMAQSLPFDALISLMLFCLIGQDPSDPKADSISPGSTGKNSSDGS